MSGVIRGILQPQWNVPAADRRLPGKQTPPSHAPRARLDARELSPPLSSSIPPSLLIFALPCPPGSLKLSTCPNHDAIGLPTCPIATANLQASKGASHTTPSLPKQIF
jgi:hypothetical protein